LCALWLTQNPETESVRGFFITYWCQRVLRMSGEDAKFSGLGERVRGAVATIWLRAAVRRTAPKLSDSLFYNPLKFNAPVRTATRKQYEPSQRR
jgi:hypothetical protein